MFRTCDTFKSLHHISVTPTRACRSTNTPCVSSFVSAGNLTSNVSRQRRNFSLLLFSFHIFSSQLFSRVFKRNNYLKKMMKQNVTKLPIENQITAKQFMRNNNRNWKTFFRNIYIYMYIYFYYEYTFPKNRKSQLSIIFTTLIHVQATHAILILC